MAVVLVVVVVLVEVWEVEVDPQQIVEIVPFVLPGQVT